LLFLDARKPGPPEVNATVSTAGSDASVTAAMAAEATRGVRPATPATVPQPMELETSSASIVRLPAGSTLPNAS
jgi:hypothetical protein